MLQRHQRNNLDQLVAFARDELDKDLQLLKDNSSRAVHLTKTASTILDMYSNLSYPLIGLQVMKQNLTNTKHPHVLQIQMILDKAQLFYLQSVKHDLTKLKADEKIQHLSPEDIKQYIEEINWKLGFERESILNESQQIGDNIDLMKFFEGVRNFQNWEENLQKRTIEKLKKFANSVQNQLTLRKGFLISKIQKIYQEGLANRKHALISALKVNSNTINKLNIFSKIINRNLKQSFTLISILTKSKNLSNKAKELFTKSAFKINKQNIMFGLRKIIRIHKNTKNLVKALSKLHDRKKLINQVHFMKKISLKNYQKCEKIGRGSEKMKNILKRMGLKTIAKGLGFFYTPLIKLLDRLYISRVGQCHSQIIAYIKDKQAMKQMISYKVKGKILLSIQRYENKPINIRKTFLDWYLKSHQEKYSKMVYNIWLNGSTSKFTFFMRLKNMINDGRKQKIRQELKVFLMVLMQRMGDYYKYCQKGFIGKWLDRHRYCKKLSNLLHELSNKSKKIDTNNLKDAYENIRMAAMKHKFLSSYLRKRMTILRKNCKTGFDVWKAIPNVKKLKGRFHFLNFMSQKLSILYDDKKQTFDKFRAQKVQGRQKKIKFVTKVFTKDILYLSYFLNTWRRNKQQIKIKESNQLHFSNKEKQYALKTIEHELNHRQIMGKKEIITKILMRTTFIKRRKQFSKKLFTKILQSSQKQNLKNSFNEYKIQLAKGKLKKENLVKELVNASKTKQGKVLELWNTGAQLQKQMQKRLMLSQVVRKINMSVKSVCDKAFENKFIYHYLQRYLKNYQNKVGFSFQCIRRLPRRIDWNKKKNVIALCDKLKFLVQRGQSNTYQKFKECQKEGQFKKKKAASKLVNFWNGTVSKAFQLYQEQVNTRKNNEKNYSLIKIMQICADIERNNFDKLMKGENIWKKKADSFYKLNVKVTDRLRQAYKLWHNCAKDLTYLKKVTDERKKRVLQILAVAVRRNQKYETINCLNLFLKNKKIIQLQTNFLRKLCDSQAGKVIKAMMIWKNLPKPKNKELIAKASKFQRNLHNFADKVFRTSFNRFKDEHYFGNDRKKLAIRTLVARSCTGIQKYFDVWKKNNKLTTLFSQCHKVQSLFQRLTQTQAKNLQNLIQGNRTKKIQKSLQNNLRWWNKHCQRLFTIWRNKTFILKQQDEKKEKNLLNLAEVQKIVQNRKKQQIIKKLKKRLILRNALSRYFLQNKMLNIKSSIEKIKSLPDRLNSKKLQNRRKSIINLFKKLQNEIKDDKVKVLQIFRQEKIRGNYKKMRSCQGYLKDKISQVHKILTLWVNLKRADFQKKKQMQIQNFFSRITQINYSNFTQILESVRLTQMKRRCFDKLCSALQIKKKGLFNIWRSKVKQIKINEFLDRTNKKNILQKINKLVSGTSQQTIKKTIKNFHLNFKISNIQVKFIQRLLQTKSGKVLQAFNKWKKIPNQNLMEKYKKGQKFFFKLEGLIKNKLSETHSSFKNNGEQGSTMKKQSVLQLLEITSSGIRRYYNRWIRITKRDHTLKQANSMMHSLDALHHCVTDVFKILFEDQRSTRVKTWAIQKLITASCQNTGIYFNKWRDCVKTIKMSEQFQKKQKSTALKMFANVLGGSESILVRQIIDKFHKNLAISKISRNFLNRLLKTKSGKVVQLFEIWKSIPDVKIAKRKKKAIKFESNLNKISLKYIKTGFQPFKSSSHEARNRKRICIQKLIRASMGEQKKKFILWRQIVKQQKMLRHTHLFDSIFEKLQDNVNNSFGIVVKNTPQQVRIKKNLCRRLLNNASFVQHHAYLIWKQALQSDNVKIEKTESKVRQNLLNLINVNEKIENRKLVQIIALFKKKHNFRNKIQSDVLKQNKNKKAIVFYDKLANFTNKNLGLFINEVKKSHSQLTFLNKNKSLEKSFQNLNLIAAESFLIMFRSNRQTIIMEKALSRIFDNFRLSTQKAFNLWREYKNILIIQGSILKDKKKNVLEILNRCIASQDGIKIPFIISKFEKNYKSLKLRKQILTKILQCKAGKVPLAFMIWKSLPNPGAKKLKQKAMKFESGLARLVSKNLRGTYEKFKDETYEGNNKKKLAVRKLILVTMSGSNKYFNNWRKVSSEAKITQKMQALAKFFDGTTDTLKQRLTIFNNAKQENQKKVLAVLRIGENTHFNLLWVINQWRSTIKDNKCYSINTTLTKFQPAKFNERLTKEAFMKIKNKADMQALRTYINSLWKWKMSNIQANYYAKFIKVFKQSQELIILSDCLNRKKYENLHFAFRRIICEGTNRHQRKSQITQKYFMRKLNNYFQRFKLNAMLEQISTWRNMYKSTIKGKKLIDLIEQFARKQLYECYHTIMYQQTSQRACQKFANKLENFKGLLLRSSFNKINTVANSIRITHLFDILQKITLKVKQSAMNVIAGVTKVSALSNSIKKISETYILRNGFSKIQQKAVLKVKCKLAINLITLLQKQKLNSRIQSALFKFKKQSLKISTLWKILNKLSQKQRSNMKQLYNVLHDSLDKRLLLKSFKKGMAVKKILDKQDTKALKRIFNLLKKKENKWLLESIKRFVIRSNIKSSQAVSLWRLKAFQAATLTQKKQ